MFFTSLLSLATHIALTGSLPGLTILTPTIAQGETAIIRLYDKPLSLSIDGAPLSFFPYDNEWRAIAPVSLNAPLGKRVIVLAFELVTITESFTVEAGIPTVIILPVPPKLNQTPKQLVQNLAQTNTSIKKAVEYVADAIYFTKPFAYPVDTDSPISSPFNEVRKTGEERITHLGTDFDLPKGTPVSAINDGVVQNAYLDSLYGNSIIIDHGKGIYSLYLHLNELFVKTGERVTQGGRVGTIGETGLASAPHLHLSIKINSVSIDPIQFINSFQ